MENKNMSNIEELFEAFKKEDIQLRLLECCMEGLRATKTIKLGDGVIKEIPDYRVRLKFLGSMKILIKQFEGSLKNKGLKT